MRNQCNEVCRMPWFLVEVKPNEPYSSTRNTEYFIVHSVDINEVYSSNMYVNGSVKFDHNQRTVEGIVLLASEDRAFVEYEMQKLTNKLELKKQKERLFLVQYSKTNRDLVHAIIPESDLFFIADGQDNRGEVLVKVAQNHHQATVLLTFEDDKQTENEFEKIKTWCLEKFLNNAIPMESNITTDYWILVQYCKSPFEVVYAIFNERETNWSDQNLYKEVVTYIQVGSTIYQALILAKSQNLQHLIADINSIKECATLSSLIQMESVQNSNLKSTVVDTSLQQYSENMISTSLT